MKKVLIVDDAAFVRYSLKHTLEKYGFEVVGEACDGKSCLRMFSELKPDIVTLDITMPEMNGIEVLKKIMEIDRNAKVVMITALGQEEKVKEAVLNGAKGFIVKPYKEEHLVKLLNSL
ncbi:response regulator [Caldicellulosiruptor changbaiensis]|uniref:Response regulator n=1 Tax=Caldicellulosiruptor changbaiensis TaxID=1222016 RepID=A0A3T0D6Q9_9FIRM|nr:MULTISPECIES: response regulator [Caldicellulosiruptor]AZT90775.1 response regulator [Caldicellulosiruptor changbaiensis]